MMLQMIQKELLAPFYLNEIQFFGRNHNHNDTNHDHNDTM